MRTEGLIRLVRIFRALESGERFTLADLAERYDVHTRTIRRYLYAIEEGFGISLEHSNDVDGQWRGYWWLPRGHNTCAERVMADVVERAIQDISRTIREVRREPSTGASTQDGDHFSFSFTT